MTAQFLAVIVVYGCDPEQTISFKSLVSNIWDHTKLRIIVWDNSPVPQKLGQWANVQRVEYRSTPENLGLSTIYNRVIAEDLLPTEHLLLLDQDSDLPTDCLGRMAAAIDTNPDIDLFLPLIRANGRWVSPLRFFFGWGRYWQEPKTGRMSTKGLCAINSGMVISSRYLLGRQNYDEALRFYGTDTQFVLDHADRREQLVVVDCVVNHDLSFYGDDPARRLQKFSVMKDATRHIYARRGWLARSMSRIVMTAVGLLYAFRYRSGSAPGSDA